jgi:hypothetical protein
VYRTGGGRGEGGGAAGEGLRGAGDLGADAAALGEGAREGGWEEWAEEQAVARIDGGREDAGGIGGELSVVSGFAAVTNVNIRLTHQ